MCGRLSIHAGAFARAGAFIKCVCKAGHVAVTTIPRVRVKMIITGIVFNASFGFGQMQIAGIAVAVEKI